MEDEERRRKLQAGKEKLAAYKKRAKRKKKRVQGPDGQEYDVTASDASSYSDFGGFTSESDQDYMSGNEAEKDGSRFQPGALERVQHELEKKSQKIRELEETVYGKQAALDSVISENEELRSRLESASENGFSGTPSLRTPTPDTDHSLDSISIEDVKLKVEDLSFAVSQRDEALHRLSQSLEEARDDREKLQIEYDQQAEQLAEQVALLESQLLDANATLNALAAGPAFPMQALVEAKNELVALQKASHQKDGQLMALQAAIKQRDQSLDQLTQRFTQSTADYANIHEELRNTKAKLESGQERHQRLERESAKLRENYAEQARQLAVLRKGQDAEIRAESFRLFEELRGENQTLREKERQSVDVISQLMADVEHLKKSSVLSSPNSSILSSSDLITVDSHEKQLDLLRSELDEMYGEQISQIKETMGDKYKSQIEKLSKEVKKSGDEKERLSQQVTLWQQQYVVLSQNNVSSTDLVAQISELTSENLRYKQQVADSQEQGRDQPKRSKRGAELEATKQKLQQLEAIVNEAQRYKEMVHDTEKRLEDADEQKRKYLEDINGQKTEIEKLKAALQDSVEEKQSYKSRFEAKESELKETVKAHKDELDVVLAQFEQKAKLDGMEWQQELDKEKSDKERLKQEKEVLKKGTAQNIPQHEMKMLMELQKEQVDNMRMDYEEKLKESDVVHGQKAEEMIQQHAKEIVVLRAQLEKDVMGVVAEEKRRLADEMNASFAQMMAQSSKEYEDRLLHVQTQLETLRLETAAEAEPAGVDVMDLTVKLSQTSMERDSALKSVQDLYTDRVEQKQTLDLMQSEKEALEKRILHLAKEYEGIKTERDEMKPQIEALNAENGALQERLADSSSECEQLQKSIVEEKEGVDDLKGEMDGLKQQIGQLTKERQVIETEVQQWTQQSSASGPPDLVDCLRTQFEQVKLRYAQEMEHARQEQMSALTRLDEALQEKQTVTAQFTKDMSDYRLAYDALRMQYEQMMLTKEPPSGAVSEEQELVSRAEITQLRSGYAAVYAEMNRLRDALVTMQAAQVPNDSSATSEETQSKAVETMTGGTQSDVESCPQETQTVGVTSADAATEMQAEKIDTQETQTAAEGETLTEQQQTQTQSVLASSVDTMTDVENCPQETQTVGVISADATTEMYIEGCVQETQTVTDEDETLTEQQQTQTQSVLASSVDTMTDEPQSDVENCPQETQTVDVASADATTEIQAEHIEGCTQETQTVIEEAALTEQQQTQTQGVLASSVDTMTEVPHNETHTQHTQTDLIDVRDSPDRVTDFTESSDAAEGAGESSDEVAPSLTHDSSPEFEDVDAVPIMREYSDDIGEDKTGRHLDGHMHAELQAAADHIQELLSQRNELKLTHEAESHELLKKLEGYETEMEVLKAQHAGELDATKEDLDHAMVNLERVIQEREDLKVSSAKETEQLSEQHSAEMKGMLYQMDEAEGDHGCELGSYKAQLNELKEKVERLTKEKQSLEEEYEAEMHSVIEQQDVRVKAIRESYEQEIEQLRAELTDMTNRLAEQQEEIMSQYEGHIQDLKHECEEVDSQLQQVKSEKKTLQREIMGSETQSETVRGLVEQIEELNMIRETAEHEAKNAQRKLKDSNSDYDELCDDNRRLREKIRALKSEKNELYQQVEDLMSSRANFEECLIAIQAQEEFSYARKPSLETPADPDVPTTPQEDSIAPETAQSTSHAPEVAGELEIAQKTIGQLEASKAKLMAELNELRTEYESIEADKETIRSGLDTIRSKLKELNTKEERHRDEIERLREENEELSSEVHRYKEQNERLRAVDAELRTEVDQLKDECEVLRRESDDSADSVDDGLDELRRERDEAVKRADDVIKSSEEALTLLEEAKAQYLDEITDLTDEVESAKRATAEAEVARDSYKAVLNALQGEVVMFHQQFTGAEAPDSSERAELDDEYFALLTEMQKKLEEMKMRLDEAESSAAQKAVQYDESNYLLGELKQQIADNERKQEEVMLKAEGEHGASVEALRELQAENRELKDSLTAKSREVETLQADLKSSSDDLDELKETSSSTERTNAELAEIIKAEKESYSSEVAALKEKIQDLSHQIASLEDLNNSIQDLEDGKKNMEGILAEKAAQMAALNYKLSAAAEEKERLNAKIAELEKTEEELNGVIHDLQNYRTSQQQAFDSKSAEVDMLLAEKAELQTAKGDREEKMCELKVKYDQLLSEKDSLDEEIAALRDGSDDWMKQKRSLEEEIAKKNAQENSFVAEQKQVMDLLKSLEQELADSDAEMSRLQTEREALLEERVRKDDLCEALQKSVSELEDQRESLEGDLSERSTQLKDLQALLEEARIQHEDTLKATMEDLEMQNSSNVDKVLSLTDEKTQLLNEINALKTQISIDGSETLSRLMEANTNAIEMRKEVEMMCADNAHLRERNQELEVQAKGVAEADAEKDEELGKLKEEIPLLHQELEQADADNQQVCNLESQLLMLTKENELLHDEIKELKKGNTEVTSPVTGEVFSLQEENAELKEVVKSFDKKLKADLSVAAVQDIADIVAQYEREIEANKQKIAQLSNEKREQVTMYEETLASLTSDLEGRKKQNALLESEVLQLKSHLNLPQSESAFVPPSVDQRLAEMQEQHVVEIDVLKYSLSERYEGEKSRLRVEILFDLQEEYNLKKEELEVDYEQKEKAMNAAKERDFVEELRKVKQQMEYEHLDKLEQLRMKYETDVLHQLSEGDDEMKLQNVIQSMQKDIAMLTAGRDSLLHDLDSSKQRQEELEEEVINLERQINALQADNQELNQEMEKNNLYASKDSAAEHSSDDWRITLDKLQSENLTLKDRLQGQKQAVEETEGLRPEKEEDLQASLMVLQLENQKLKTEMEDKNLSIDGDAQEEMMKLQTKYEDVMRMHTATDSMEEGFIDLKVQYEALVNENTSIKSRLDSTTGSSSLPEDVEKLVQEKEALAVEVEKVKEKARKDVTKLKAKALAASKKTEELRAKLDQVTSSDEVMNLRAVVALLTEENETLRSEQQESNEEETKLVEVAKDSKGLKQTVFSYRLRSSDHSRPGTPASFGGFLMPSGYRKPSRSQSVDCLEMTDDATIMNNNNASEGQYEELVKEVEVLREEKQHFLMRMQEMETEFQRLSHENGWPQAELQRTVCELQERVDVLTREKDMQQEMTKLKQAASVPAVSGSATLPLVNNTSVHTNNSVIIDSAHAVVHDPLLAVEVHGVHAMCAGGQEGRGVTKEEALRDLQVLCAKYVELNNQNEQLVKRNTQLNELLKTSEQSKTNDDSKMKKIKKPEVKKFAEKSKSVKESPVGRGIATRRLESPTPTPRGSIAKPNTPKGSTSSSMQDLRKLAKENEKLHEHNKDLVKKLDVALSQASKDFMSLGERYEKSGSSPAAVKAKVKSTPGKSKSSVSEVNSLKKELEDIRREFQKKCMENVSLLQVLKEGADPQDILQLRMQQEILLAEKAELCSKFEDERSQLMEDNQELVERNEQLQNQLSMVGGAPVDVMPPNNDNVRYEAVKRENRDLEVQLQMLLEEKKQVCAHLQADCVSAQQEAREMKAEVDRSREEYDDLQTKYQLLAMEPERAASVASDVSASESVFSGETFVLPERRSPMGQCLPGSELSVQYEILMQEKKTVCLQLEQQQEKCQALKAQIREMGRAMEESDENINDLTAQRQQTEMQNKILAEEKEDICKKLNALNKKCESEQWNMKQKIKELDAVRVDCTQFKNNITELLVEKEKIEQDLSILASEKKSIESALNSCQSDNKNLVDVVREMREEMHQMKDGNVELQFRLDENVMDHKAVKKEASSQDKSLRTEMDALQTQVDEMNREREELKQSLDEKDRLIIELESKSIEKEKTLALELEKLNKEIGFMNQLNKDLQGSLEDCWGGKGVLSEDLAKLREEYDEYKKEKEKEIKDLQEKNQENGTQQDGVKEALESSGIDGEDPAEKIVEMSRENVCLKEQCSSLEVDSLKKDEEITMLIEKQSHLEKSVADSEEQSLEVKEALLKSGIAIGDDEELAAVVLKVNEWSRVLQEECNVLKDDLCNAIQKNKDLEEVDSLLVLKESLLKSGVVISDDEDLSERLVNMNKENVGLKERCDGLKMEVQQKSKEILDLVKQHSHLEGRCSVLDQEKDRLAEMVAALQKEKIVVEMQLGQDGNLIKQLKKECRSLKDKVKLGVDETEKAKIGAEDDMKKLRNEKEKMEVKVREVNAAVKKLVQDLKQKEDGVGIVEKVKEERDRLIEKVKVVEVERDALREVEAKNEECMKRITEEDGRRKKLQDALEDSLREVKALSEAKEELLSSKEQNEDTIEGLNKKVAQLESKCFEMDCHLQEAQKEISAYKPLEAKLANVEDELHAVNENIMKNLVAGDKDAVILQLQQKMLSWKGKADQYQMECESLKKEAEALSNESERTCQEAEKLKAIVTNTEQKLTQSQAQCQSLMLEKSKILEECLAIEKGSSTVKDLCMEMEKNKSQMLTDLVAAQNAMVVSSEKIAALNSEMQNMMDEVQRLNELLSAKEAAIASMVTDHEKLLALKIEEIQDLHEECQAKDEEIEALQFDDAKEENDEQICESKVAEMKAKIDEMELSLEHAEKESEVLRAQKETDAKQLNQINQLYNIVNSQLNDFEVECSELKSDNAELVREVIELKERMQTEERARMGELEDLRAQNERVVNDLNERQKEMEMFGDKMKCALGEVKKKETECEDALDTIVELKQSLTKMQAGGIASDADRQELEKELEQLKAEAKRLRAALDDCEENSMTEGDRLLKENKELEERGEILQNNLTEANAKNVHLSVEFEVMKKSAAEDKKVSDEEVEKVKEEKEDLVKGMTEKEEALRQMEQQVQDLSEGVEALANAQHEIEALKAAAQANEVRSEDREVNCAELMKEMEKMKELLSESEEMMRNIANEKGGVVRERDEAIADMEDKRKELIETQTELMQVKKQVTEVLCEKDKSVEEKSHMMRDLAQKDDDLSRLEVDVTGILKQLEDKAKEVTVLREELRRLEEDRVGLICEIEDSSQRYSKSLRDKEQAEAAVSELKNAYEKMKMNEKEMEEQVSSQKVALSHLNDTASKAEADYNRLKEMYEELRTERVEEAIVSSSHENLTSTPKAECVHMMEDAASVSEQVEELLKAKMELEEALSHTEADKRDLMDAILQLKEELSVEKERQQRKMNDFQKLLDTVTAAKEKVEQELQRQRLEHEQRLTAARKSAVVDSSAESQTLLRQIKGAEKTISDLRDKLRAEEEEKDLLKLRISHLTRECQLQEGHVHDLEKQVLGQQEQVLEAMHEHKESIRLLAELRFEAEQGRQEQKGDFIRLEGELHKLESHLGGEEERKAYELKHSEMVDELNAVTQQSREMHEEKNRLSWENQLLKQTMDREQKSYRLRPSHRSMSVANVDAEALGWSSMHEISGAPGAMSKCSSMASVCSIASMDSQAPAFDFTKDLIDAKKKIRRLEQREKEMVEERESLMQQLRKQEELVIELRKAASEKQKKLKKFSFGSSSSSTQSANIATDVTGQQIVLLQKQRDELMGRLEDLEEKNKMVSLLEQNLSDVEAKLKSEKEQLRLKNQDKEKVEVDLLKERLAVEKYARDYQQLKKQLHQKEFIENQLQADVSAADASTLQMKLSEVNSGIKKAVLQKAIGVQVGESMLPWKPSPKVKKMRQVGTQVKERMLRLDCGCSTDSTMRMNVECRYHKAVDKLRRELKRDAAVREKSQSEGSQTF